jgi:4-hydroxy-tetrahydrodipicolinate reductase
MNNVIDIAVLGANGRMGRTLVHLINADPGLQLIGAATEPGHDSVGEDVGRVAGLLPMGVTLTDDPAAAVAGADVAIDFTLPAATAGNLAACVARDVEMVIGTTGLTAAERAAMAKAARKISIVYGRNMSVGINVISELARLAGVALGEEYDVEISEAHHRHKLDAPSGTALELGEAVADGRGVRFADVACHERHGRQAARERGSIGFASIRAGSIVGDHSVMFASDEEIVELRHRAVDRTAFARGALRAVRWVYEQSPGLYSMKDVLGLGKR